MSKWKTKVMMYFYMQRRNLLLMKDDVVVGIMHTFRNMSWVCCSSSVSVPTMSDLGQTIGNSGYYMKAWLVGNGFLCTS